ncbi:hypothetical protein ACEUZ9_002214 [Paracoccus litorisediminis]|uniref:hypothetical protein n=1 Tax=Paracoccus litorisediminis TaxID=2006130 RepID=UPI0037348288
MSRIVTGSDFPDLTAVNDLATYRAPGAPAPRSFGARGWELPSIYDYGVIADGVTDNTAAINAAWASLAAAGRIPLLGVPPSAGQIRVAGALNPPAGAGLVGLFGRPVIYMSGTNQITISNPGFILSGLTLLGDHATTNYKLILASTAARFSDLTLSNWNSGVDVTGNRNDLVGIELINVRGAGLRIRGGRYNTLERIEGVNVTNFLTYLSEGAAFNNVHQPRKRVDFATLTAWQHANYASDIGKGRFGLECVGITFDCYRNSVFDYYAEYTGDAGFSCSGYENTIAGGRVIECEGNALTFIGSRNSAANIVSIGNKRGIAAIPTAGGLAKDNVIVGCVGINNWYAGFSNELSQIREWVAGGGTEAASSYCRYGLNNYQTEDKVAVNNFGTIAPVHTSGLASDGLNSWRWVSSDPATLHADRNRFIGCVGIGGGGGRTVGSVVETGKGTDFYIEPGSGLLTRFYASSNE